MRTVTQFKKISVTKETYDRLQKDKAHFQKTIGGGKWSISDTIKEYLSILEMIKEEAKKNDKNKQIQHKKSNTKSKRQ